MSLSQKLQQVANDVAACAADPYSTPYTYTLLGIEAHLRAIAEDIQEPEDGDGQG